MSALAHMVFIWFCFKKRNEVKSKKNWQKKKKLSEKLENENSKNKKKLRRKTKIKKRKTWQQKKNNTLSPPYTCVYVMDVSKISQRNEQVNM